MSFSEFLVAIKISKSLIVFESAMNADKIVSSMSNVQKSFMWIPSCILANVVLILYDGYLSTWLHSNKFIKQNEL